MFRISILSLFVLLLLSSNSYAGKCDLGKLPPLPQIPDGATASKEAMKEAAELAKNYEEKAGKMMDSCKRKPEFMILLNNSYDISTKLDYEMDIFQNRSESDIGGIRGDALK